MVRLAMTVIPAPWMMHVKRVAAQLVDLNALRMLTRALQISARRVAPAVQLRIPALNVMTATSAR
jgi:hypothetical protein